jgi:hypothetical protein
MVEKVVATARDGGHILVCLATHNLLNLPQPSKLSSTHLKSFLLHPSRQLSHNLELV